jgi:hypothetical protein
MKTRTHLREFCLTTPGNAVEPFAMIRVDLGTNFGMSLSRGSTPHPVRKSWKAFYTAAPEKRGHHHRNQESSPEIMSVEPSQ